MGRARARTPASSLQPLVQLDAKGVPIFIEPLKIATLNGFLKAQTPAQVLALDLALLAYGVVNPAAALASKGNLVARVAAMTPDDSRYQAERDRATKSAGAGVIAAMRAAATKAQSIESVGGRVTQEVEYVNEGPNPCEECLVLGGLVMPMNQFISQGKMPGDRCLGGPACYCQLLAVN